MNLRKMIIAVLGAASLVMLANAPVHAKKDGRDHNDASEAVRKGNALPISTIMKKVAPRLGEILEIELDEEDGRLVYEIKYLDKSGRRMEAYVDARSGRLISKSDN